MSSSTLSQLMKGCLLMAVCFLSSSSVDSVFPKKKCTYALTKEPIDVVIPCVEKDKETLEMCIEGIRKNGENIRRIIVISEKKLTDQAEWFDESLYPFSKYDIALEIFHDEKDAKRFVTRPSRVGWIYQQLLKLYSPYVIPDISSNVLLLDSDTIFLHPVRFINEEGEGLYNVGFEYHVPYFDHAGKLLPGFRRIFSGYSGICHHMLLQKPVLDDLFTTIETTHNTDCWRAFLRCIDHDQLSGSCMSEYEVYFNFVFAKTRQVHLRLLKWENIYSLSEIPEFAKNGYHYISSHAYERR